MKIHELKTLDTFYYRVFTGQKPFEVRKNDRDFQIGDTLLLKEVDSNVKYTGRESFFEITYILQGGLYGIADGHCVMGIKSISHLPNKQ